MLRTNLLTRSISVRRNPPEIATAAGIASIHASCAANTTTRTGRNLFQYVFSGGLIELLRLNTCGLRRFFPLGYLGTDIPMGLFRGTRIGLRAHPE